MLTGLTYPQTVIVDLICLSDRDCMGLSGSQIEIHRVYQTKDPFDVVCFLCRCWLLVVVQYM